jgi:hypothetical protein
VTVVVRPDQFTMVLFEAATIERVMSELLARLDFGDRAVVVEVDEASPIARVTVQATDPVILRVESGAFEDARRPRHLSEQAVAGTTGRVLLRLRDRRDGSFASAPPDDALSLAHASAWDAYAVGRLGRLGYGSNGGRWRYNFRTRHGFSDAADHAFARLWEADRLTWPELAAISDEARAAAA